MRISILPDVFGKTVQPYDESWETFAARLLNPPTYPNKQACPLVKLAVFGDKRTTKGSLRHDENILSCSGVEGDHDKGTMPPFMAHALLEAAGIAAAIYTSPSHTDAVPRWRVLAPFSDNLQPSARREMIGRINGVLGAILEPESFTLSQSFYLYRVADAPYEAYISQGACIDTLLLPAVYPASAPIAPADNSNHPDREATDETISELRDALKHISSDDRNEWIAVGIALSGIGERGYELWAEWSATSPKHDPLQDLARWETFQADRTGFASVFSKAQALGWTNPKARVPINTTEVFGAAHAQHSAASDAPIPAAVSCLLKERSDSGVAMIADQQKLFAGCVHVVLKEQVLTPEGELLNRQQFHNVYGKFAFVKTKDGAKMEQNAWTAFVNSQCLQVPQVGSTCFRPDLPLGAIVNEAGRSYVNTFIPIRTACVEGDVSLMVTHINKLLPYGQDAALFTSLLAAMIQYPGKKFTWCPAMQGTKGNGKSFIGRVMQEIIGRDYTHYPNSQDITNKFTGWLDRKLLIVIEELSTHEKRESLEMLKPLITNPYVEMQKKGQDQITGENRANFLIFVNHKNAVPIDDDERRYAAFFTAQQSAADIARDGMDGDYFRRLFTWAENGGFSHWHYYLKHYPIPDEMNPATTLYRAPHTSSTAESIEASRGTVELEVLEAIAQQRGGFCGGWIAHTALDKYLTERKLDRVMPIGKRRELLRSLGYDYHPGLQKGRVNNPIAGYDRPTLYITHNHPMRDLTGGAKIAEAFLAAQRVPGAIVPVFSKEAIS